MCRSTFGCRGGLLSADPYSERLPSLPTGDELQSIDATTEVCDHIQLKVPALCLPLGPTPMVWTDLICGLVNYMYDFRFISSCLRQSGQAYDARRTEEHGRGRRGLQNRSFLLIELLAVWCGGHCMAASNIQRSRCPPSSPASRCHPTMVGVICLV